MQWPLLPVALRHIIMIRTLGLIALRLMKLDKA